MPASQGPTVAVPAKPPQAHTPSSTQTAPPPSATRAPAEPQDNTPAAAQAALPASPRSRCVICLEDHASPMISLALRCAHAVCTGCLREMWTRNIIDESVAFPKCPVPDCAQYAADAAVAALVGGAATRRMRQLRGLHPARAADGRRMFCVRSGCCEQLPPAVETPGGLVSTCPECGQGACFGCACVHHPGRGCVEALESEQARKTYNTYAVGKVAACPRCGVHVELDGECSSVTCTRCRQSFRFQPFRTLTEAEAAALVGELGRSRVRSRKADGAVRQRREERRQGVNVRGIGEIREDMNLGSIFFGMVMGSLFGGWALSMFLVIVERGADDFVFIHLILFALLGSTILLLFFFLFNVVGVQSLRRIGGPGGWINALVRGVAGAAILSSSSLCVYWIFIVWRVETETKWFCAPQFLPYIVCGAELLVLAVGHVFVRLYRVMLPSR